LHSLKYLHRPICGVILATSPPNQEGWVGDRVIPLLHSEVVLTDVLNTALEQLQLYVSQTQFKIVGMYYAEAHNTPTNSHCIMETLLLEVLKSINQPTAMVLKVPRTHFDLELEDVIHFGEGICFP
jgi:hypothetical protein